MSLTPTRRSVLVAGGTAATVGIAGARPGPRQERLEGSVRDGGLVSGSTWVAGAARVDATPTDRHLEEGVWLGGYGVGRGRLATDVHDGCFAKAVAFGPDRSRVAIVSVDVPGLGNALIERIRLRARARAGLDVDAVLVAATHTHAGPDTQGLWGGVPRSYRHYIVDRASAAIERAVATAEPVTAVAGSESVPDHASNRRGWDDVIDDLSVLHFVGEGDSGVGTVVTYPAHTVVIGSGEDRVATDYAGPLERTVEEELGGVCAFVPGVLGDASPSLEDPDGQYGADYERAAALGGRLGERVSTVVDGGQTLSPELHRRTRPLRLPMDNCVFRVAYDSGLLRRYYDGETAPELFFSRIAGLLEPLGVDGVPRRLATLSVDAVPTAIPTRVSRVTLGGDLDLVTVPGEAVTNLGLEVRDVVGDGWMPLGMTHDTLGYLLTASEFGSVDGQTYEETVSMGPDTGERYLAAVRELMGEGQQSVPRTPLHRRTCAEIQTELRDAF